MDGGAGDTVRESIDEWECSWTSMSVRGSERAAWLSRRLNGIHGLLWKVWLNC